VVHDDRDIAAGKQMLGSVAVTFEHRKHIAVGVLSDAMPLGLLLMRRFAQVGTKG